MEARTFVGRRGMRPSEALAGRLEGWVLAFDLPVGPGERGVANLHPRPGDYVWGVLYAITPSEATRLDRSEGVHRGAYTRVQVAVVSRDGRSLPAFTYCSRRSDPTRKPSRRYLGLLLAGARDHGLPADYVEILRGLDLALDEREAGQQTLFDD
jgi:cation transport regulator ChaC